MAPPTSAEGLDPTTSPCGFLVLDKPAGPTSHDCVAAVRRAYGLRRVGHGGTLDPAVTGVLPIALGPATRLLPYLSGEKRYDAVLQLGVRSSTDDLQGEILSRDPVPCLDQFELEQHLADFRGAIQQRPPAVSAVHVRGERAYDLARRGVTVDLSPRPVTIHSLRLRHWDPGSARLDLEVGCSAGTYIRSLARDLGERLGCGGALAQLRRTSALGFGLAGAVGLETLKEAGGPPALRNPLEALAHLPRRHLLDSELVGWRCGRSLPLPPGSVQPALTAAFAQNPDDHPGADVPPIAVIHPDGSLAGIGRCDPEGRLQPRLVLSAAG